MSLIKLNLEEPVVSESAKQPSYKIAKVNGVATLVITSAKKAELTTIVSSLKKARAAGVTAARNYDAWARAKAKAMRLTGDPKRKGMAKAADFKQKATAALKESRLHFKEATAYARKHGLSGLRPTISKDSLSGISERATFVLRNLRLAKLTEFQVAGKRGAYKPKFVKESAFEALGSKTITKAAKKAPARPTTATGLSKKPSNAEARRRAEKRIEAIRAEKARRV